MESRALFQPMLSDVGWFAKFLYKRSYLDNTYGMKSLTKVQQGFIPLLIAVLLLMIGVIVLAYLRVAKLQQ